MLTCRNYKPDDGNNNNDKPVVLLAGAARSNCKDFVRLMMVGVVVSLYVKTSWLG